MFWRIVLIWTIIWTTQGKKKKTVKGVYVPVFCTPIENIEKKEINIRIIRCGTQICKPSLGGKGKRIRFKHILAYFVSLLKARLGYVRHCL